MSDNESDLPQAVPEEDRPAGIGRPAGDRVSDEADRPAVLASPRQTPFFPERLEHVPPPRADVFWGWHDLFLFVLIALVVLVGITVPAAIGISSLLHISEPHRNMVLVVAQFAGYGMAFSALKLMFRAEYGAPLLRSLHWQASPIDPLRLALIGLGQAFAIAILGTFMRIPEIESPMSRLLSDRPTAIVIAVLGVTVVPLAEELAFRGLMQPLLIRSIGVVPGIVITSAVFGVMHLEQYRVWQSAALIALAGAGFGVMRHWSGSTRASAIMHAGYNSALFLLFFSQKGTHV